MRLNSRGASLLEKMRELCYIAAFGLLLGMAFPAAAEEGYDQLLFSNERESHNKLFSIMPPTPPKGIAANPVAPNPQQSEPGSSASLPEIISESADSPSYDKAADEEVFVPASQPSIPEQETSPAAPPPVQPRVDISHSLTDNFKATEQMPEDETLPKDKGTWISKITERAAEKVKESAEGIDGSEREGGTSLEGLMKSSKSTKKRANASVFDVSGVMLRMTLPQAEAAMKRRNFTKVSVKYEIPNFIKWRNEEKCRNNGVVGYERLASCVVDLAKKGHHQYSETVRFSRFDTKEELEIKLTSNFTNNKVYRVLYKSLSPAITGNSNKAAYLRNVKIYDFWKKVSQKYGAPDNKDEVLWGMGGNKPYLKASSGVLLLEDPMLRELDYTRMSREDQRFFNTDLYNF